MGDETRLDEPKVDETAVDELVVDKKKKDHTPNKYFCWTNYSVRKRGTGPGAWFSPILRVLTRCFYTGYTYL